jgi:hypothetical protein
MRKTCRCILKKRNRRRRRFFVWTEERLRHTNSWGSLDYIRGAVGVVARWWRRGENAPRFKKKDPGGMMKIVFVTLVLLPFRVVFVSRDVRWIINSKNKEKKRKRFIFWRKSKARKEKQKHFWKWWGAQS